MSGLSSHLASTFRVFKLDAARAIMERWESRML